MIHSVHKAMQLLSLLSDARNAPLTISELSNRTKMPKPTVSHILSTLCEGGYAERVSHTDGYRLGPSMYYLTRHGRYEEELVSLCRPVMRWMERKSHATVILSVIHSNRKYIIDYADSEQRIFEDHQNIRLGDVYRTATGRAILAQMDEERLFEFYEKYGTPGDDPWEEVTSYEALRSELSKLRGRKLITTRTKKGGETQYAYAYPIFREDVCIGAVGIAYRGYGESTEEYRAVEERLVRILGSGVKEISRRIGYDG